MKANSLAPFMAAMEVNARASVRAEPGCLVFDVLRDRSDPDVLYVYEVYRDEAAFAAHMLSEHFLASRPLLDPLIVSQEIIEADGVLLIRCPARA